MSKLKILILLIILLNFNKYSNANLIDIKVKVQDEIITNLDIQNEKRYLFFLNPKLKELKTSRSNSIAKESLITETIKRKEIEKFYDFNKKNNLINTIEKNLLLKKNIKNRDELKEILENKKINYEDVKKKLLIETLWNKLVYEKYVKNVIINKEDLRKKILLQFNNKQKKFDYNLSEIVISENINKNFKKKFSIINKSLKEIGFENTANIHSISNTANNGGLIGWVNELQISTQINSQIKNLKINEISKPIKIANGYILIKVNDKKEVKNSININDQLEKVIIRETNRQLNSFSMIFYKRLKKNIEIYEY
tara:strand:+ start:4621 stop:5553 length:933 start_codon:yes stop_codon:yes gene_type:complete